MRESTLNIIHNDDSPSVSVPSQQQMSASSGVTAYPSLQPLNLVKAARISYRGEH